MDRRANVRIPLKLSCSLELGGGALFSGYTRNLSRDGAEMECSAFCAPGRRPPRVGDVGLFTLNFRKGANVDCIKVNARVVYVMGSLAGLNLFVNELGQAQRENFSRILQSGQGKID